MDHRGEQGIGEYLAVLRRRWWIIAICAILAPTVAVVLARQQPKLFSASADVLLTSSATGVSSPLGSDLTSGMQTQQEIASSPAVAERVRRATGLTDRSAAQIAAEASFSAVGAAQVMRMTIRDANAGIATRLANAYASQYTQYERALDTSLLANTRNEIEARMKALRVAGQQGTSVYQTLAQKAQDLAAAEALETSSAVVLRPATGAVQIQPTPKRAGILGLAVGIVLGLTLALLWEALDPRVRTAHDIAALLGLPILGQVPTPSRQLRRKRRLVMLADASGTQAEAMRILRTNFDFANVEHRARMVLVTSANEGEGKSTTAANLAIALSRAGRSVMLVDLDLRRPIVDKLFNLGDVAGLTSVVLGYAPLESAIAHVAFTGNIDVAGARNGNGTGSGSASAADQSVTVLDVIPSGPIPPNPGEFVASTAVRSLLASLRDRADVVLIDTPPLLETSDTLSLSAAVDAVIVVNRVPRARRAQLHRLRRVLDAMPAVTLGVVLTGAERDRGYAYDRYGYYASHSVPSNVGARESEPSQR